MGSLGGVRVVGPWWDYSSYAKLRRELVLALADLGVPVQLAHRAPDDQAVGDDPLLARLRALERPIDASVALHVNLPEWARPEPNRVNLLYSQFEADRIPASWAEQSRPFDLVVVPAWSSAEAWVRGGFPVDRLRLCPQGVRQALWAAPVPAVALLAAEARGRPLGSYGTRVLNVADIVSGFRKNLGGLLAAWVAATDRSDNAVLVLKWGTGRGPEAARRYFDEVARRVAAAVGKPLEAAAPVHLLPGNYREDEMPGLFAAGTHYLSVSHGEGWDLPMVEAGAAGLRLIAPDHTGYRAYLNETIATLLPSRPVAVDTNGLEPMMQRNFAGANWWEPDLDAAAVAIRDAVAGRDRHRPTARGTILRDFTWERAAEGLLAVVAEHLGVPVPPAARPRPPEARPAFAAPPVPTPAVADRGRGTGLNAIREQLLTAAP